MALVKKIKDRKVNIEFNKEFIKVINEKIKDQDTDFLAKSLKELLPADSADIIENLSPENRSKLIELEGFNIDPEIFVELNESIQTEIFLLLSVESIASLLKKLEKPKFSFEILFLSIDIDPIFFKYIPKIGILSNSFFKIKIGELIIV